MSLGCRQSQRHDMTRGLWSSGLRGNQCKRKIAPRVFPASTAQQEGEEWHLGMAYSTEAVLVALLSSAAAFLGSYISLYGECGTFVCEALGW